LTDKSKSPNYGEQVLELTKPADEIIESKNCLKILIEVRKKKRRFGELQSIFGSPATLTIRLRELEKLRLLRRELQIDEESPQKRNPAIIYYAVTPKGERVAQLYQEFRNRLGLLLAEKQEH
jgi:DNA-binding HxlR family transcriptional regulator